jgi:hypothetical protein
LAELKKIKNTYVSPAYLRDETTLRKTKEVEAILDHSMRQNRSSFPIACLHFQSYFLSRNVDEKIPALILLILIFAGPLVFVKKKNLIMYFSASALAGFEIIILLTLQLIIGNMYQLTGLIIAGLMTGLAVGAGFEIPFFNRIPTGYRSLIICAYYTAFGLLYNYIILLGSGVPVVVLIIVSAFVPAMLTGNIFRELTVKTNNMSSAASVYSADLSGSAFGFILITAVAISFFGIQISVFLLSVLIFTGFLLGTNKNKL